MMSSTNTDIKPVPPKILPMGRTPVFTVIGLAAITAAVLVVLFIFNPAEHGFFPACPFHKITGLNCPGCGSTRALHELLHGHIIAALHANALLICSLPFVIWLAVRFAICRWRGQPASGFVFQPKWLWIFLGVTLVFAVLRNLPQFAWLSP